MTCAILLAGITLAVGALVAQDDTEKKPGAPTGSLTGLVTYSDTKAPARLAQVTLLKVVPAGAKTQTADELTRTSIKDLMGGCALKCIAAAGLDGRFTMDEIPVGRYIVLAGQSGAVNPLSLVDLEALNKAGAKEVTEDQVKDALAYLTVATVEAGKTADVTVSLVHGASIAGTLSYDDGAPAVGVRVHLLSRTKAGDFAEPNMLSLGGASSNATLIGFMTDDKGQFRIAGLGPGTYALRAEVPLSVVKNLSKNLKGILAMSMANPKPGAQASMLGSMMGDGLSVYSGGVLFKKDLKPIELGKDEQMHAADITIPLGGMHTVTARVVDSTSGKGLEVARVLLLDADGKETLRSGFVDDDGNCSFEYVPDGMYTLRAVDAMDVSQVGKMLSDNYDPKKAVRYKTAESKLQVSGEVSGVLLQVSRAEEKEAAK
jgi:hypothetical protein